MEKASPQLIGAPDSGMLPAMSWRRVCAWIAAAFGLEKGLALGLILVACCPGGTASNVIAYLARANVALSVLMNENESLRIGLGGKRAPTKQSGSWKNQWFERNMERLAPPAETDGFWAAFS